MVNLNELKMEYNYNLNRLYKGCNYLEEHPDEEGRYYCELKKIYDKASKIFDEIIKYEEVTPEEAVEGFKIC